LPRHPAVAYLYLVRPVYRRWFFNVFIWRSLAGWL